MPSRNLIFIGLATVIALCCHSISAKNRHASIFSEALQIIQNEALVETSERQLFDAAMNGMMAEIDINKQAMRDAASGGHSTATDLADWLVRVLNMPFRDAHHVTGTLVAKADETSKMLSELSLDTMQAVEPRITKDIFSVLNVDASVASRTSYGGTAPENVRSQAQRWIDNLTSKETS